MGGFVSEHKRAAGGQQTRTQLTEYTWSREGTLSCTTCTTPAKNPSCEGVLAAPVPYKEFIGSAPED